MNATATASDTGRLRAAAVASALLARVLGPDTTAMVDPATLDASRVAVGGAGAEGALARFGDGRSIDEFIEDPAELAGRWVRWFELGRVAPYEAVE